MASGPPWLVSGFRFRARLGFVIPSTFSGPRGVTPAFGYGTPHSGARGTLTLLNTALLSARYRTLTFVLVGLTPTEYTSLRWTYKDHVFPGKFGPIGELDENFGVRDLGAHSNVSIASPIVVIS